jgi:transposase
MNFLEKAKRVDFEQKVKKTKDVSERNRLCVILAWDEKKEITEISNFLRLSESSVRRYIDEYIEQSKSNNNPKGGSFSKLNREQEESLKQHLEEVTYRHIKQICLYVKKTYGLVYSRTGMEGWLKRKGFVYKRPKNIPQKIDLARQQQFIECYQELKNNLKEGEAIFFMDEVHPSHQAHAAHGWIKKGKEKTLRTSARQERLHIVGAIELEQMTLISQELPYVDSKNIVTFIKRLKKQSKYSKIYLVCDNAAYHKSDEIKDLTKKGRVQMVYLPPYSPNLNPIERLWKVLRERITYNQIYETFVDFSKAIRGFFTETVPKIQDTLRSRINDNFHIIIPNPVCLSA